MPLNQNSVVNEQSRFRIYASRLKDSPYKSGEDEWPQYNEDKVLNLANEIVNGNKTCYLVSGYRGVGKTSFILQVQEKTEKLLDEKRSNIQKSETSSEEIPECLFVLTNFSKYENHKSLLRRMIRDVYQEYEKKTKATIPSEKEKIFKEKIEDLYKRTFQDIKTQLSTSDTSEIKMTGETDVSSLVKKALPLLIQTIIAGTGSWYFINQWMKSRPVLAIILFIACILWLIFSLVKVTINFTRTQTKESKNTIEDIYDDEIADFKFHELLDSFTGINYRLVFVLDELDKVSIDDLDNLIKEMKPYLLSGKAHFIIVAGQELAYRYLWAYSGDDAVIGSLFSKFYHIPLFTRDSLEEIGKRLINLDNVSSDSISKLSPLFDYLIFKCRRVPRAFVSRFRQIVVWDIDENKEQIPYITIPDKQTTELHVQTLAMIKEIERLSITPKQYEPVLSDYLITQIFINAQQMIFAKDYPQSIDDYLERYSKSGQLADKAYYQNVEEILRDLFSRMKQENIIKEKIDERNEINDNEAIPPGMGNDLSPENKDQANTMESIKPVSSDNIPELLKFKKDWLDFIGALNLFWDDEAKRKPSIKDPNKTYYNFLEYFNSIKAISFIPIHAKSLIDIINQPYLLEGNDRLASFRDQLKTHSINPMALQRQLTEFIIKQILNTKLSNNYNEQSLTGFDAAFVGSEQPDLLIDFRHSESSESDRSDIEKMIEKLSGYNLITKKGNIIVVIETFFNSDSDINENLLTDDFNSQIENLNPVYSKRIIYFPISKQIKENSLEKLVDGFITYLSPYKEFLINDRIEEKQKKYISNKKLDPEDPQKFLWGQKSEANGRKLEAAIIPIGKESKMFRIALTVKGSEEKPLRGFVYFLVHPTFPEEIYKVLAKNNLASLELEGYGAFTTGVVCDEGSTELELDLNELKDAPKDFYYKEPTKSISSNAGGNKPNRPVSVKKNMKK